MAKKATSSKSTTTKSAPAANAAPSVDRSALRQAEELVRTGQATDDDRAAAYRARGLRKKDGTRAGSIYKMSDEIVLGRKGKPVTRKVLEEAINPLLSDLDTSYARLTKRIGEYFRDPAAQVKKGKPPRNIGVVAGVAYTVTYGAQTKDGEVTLIAVPKK